MSDNKDLKAHAAGYSAENMLRVARRVNNTKRQFLLVNPLQAKHLPVCPSDSMNMMKTLGGFLAEKYPQTKLVIGFAETATAIGAVVAESFSSDCIYVHTTRENVNGVHNWVEFQEEHSHAVEQKLADDEFAGWIEKTETIIFVEDEISTGKTLRNMIAKLKERYTSLKSKRLVAASLLNGLSDEDRKKMAEEGILVEYLAKTPNEDFAGMMKACAVSEAPDAKPLTLNLKYQSLFSEEYCNPRCGVEIGCYKKNCESIAETFLVQFAAYIKEGSKILVLGTEECMYPALTLGYTLETMGRNYNVSCHATTRSPIGIGSLSIYPITKGSKLISFYDCERKTYVYELAVYDAVIVVSDTEKRDLSALEQLAGALPAPENTLLFYMRKGSEVLWTRLE